MKCYREFTKKELKWIRSLERVMGKAPNSLFMFIAGSMLIMPKDETNQRYINKSGCMDNECPGRTIFTSIEMDGGDW